MRSSGWTGRRKIVGACALVFGPIAFAGVIFAATFGRSTQPDRVFGANVAGALLGGLAENASVVLGSATCCAWRPVLLPVGRVRESASA